MEEKYGKNLFFTDNIVRHQNVASIINPKLSAKRVSHINDYSVAKRYPRDVQTLLTGHTLLIERRLLLTVLYLVPFNLTMLNRKPLFDCLLGYVGSIMEDILGACELPWVLCGDFNPTNMMNEFNDFAEKMKSAGWSLAFADIHDDRLDFFFYRNCVLTVEDFRTLFKVSKRQDHIPVKLKVIVPTKPSVP
jgi:hypothetical protein